MKDLLLTAAAAAAAKAEAATAEEKKQRKAAENYFLRAASIINQIKQQAAEININNIDNIYYLICEARTAEEAGRRSKGKAATARENNIKYNALCDKFQFAYLKKL